MRNALWLASLALAFFFLGVASAQQATTSTIYCQESGKVWNALSEEGHFECAGALMQGEACFVGRRSEIIEHINNLEVSWDEEWLESAQYVGRNAIAYTWVDGPNELREDRLIQRCTAEFFH
jgi:hypothetical protein